MFLKNARNREFLNVTVTKRDMDSLNMYISRQNFINKNIISRPAKPTSDLITDAHCILPFTI